MKIVWEKTSLANLIQKVIDYRGKTPLKLGGDWEENNVGYRALSAKNIKTGHIVSPETIRYVNQALYDKWMKDEILRGDILITSEAPFGEVYQWNSDEKIVLSQRLFAIRANNRIHAHYLYYYLTTHKFQQEMRARATGTTVIGLRQPELLKCIVYYPLDKTAQAQIASILQCIDRKIEINTLINRNLEQQAQAIFKSWFVETVNPHWHVGTIADLGEVVGGSTPSKAHSEYYTEHGIAWITPKDLSMDKSKFIAHGENDITQAGVKNSSAKVMPKGTVLFSSRAPIGYIAIAAGEVCTNQGFKSVVPHVHIATPYVYFFLKENLPSIEGVATGSTFKEVSGSAMKSVPAIIPDSDTLNRFTELCVPIFTEQEKLEAESRRLATLRDTLLPRLMSGEIDVSEVEV